jgi:trehalose-phosphatase
VEISPAVRTALKQISRTGVVVGVISGRKLSDIETRVAVPGLWYVGAHGYFVRRRGVATLRLLTSAEKVEMALVRRRLEHWLRGVPGIVLEPKEATIAVHYRQASDGNARVALSIIRTLLREYPHLRLLSGKKVWELLPASDVDKWTAIRAILDAEKNGAAKTPRWLVIYVGDDTTDEAVFSKMRGISIAIGKRRNTAAEFFLNSTRDVPQFLDKLCGCLNQRSDGR